MQWFTFIDSLIFSSLIYWFIGSLIHWFTESSVHRFTETSVHCIIVSLVGSFGELCMDSFMSSHWNLNHCLLIRWCTSQLQRLLLHLKTVQKKGNLLPTGTVHFGKLPPRHGLRITQLGCFSPTCNIWGHHLVQMQGTAWRNNCTALYKPNIENYKLVEYMYKYRLCIGTQLVYPSFFTWPCFEPRHDHAIMAGPCNLEEVEWFQTDWELELEPKTPKQPIRLDVWRNTFRMGEKIHGFLHAAWFRSPGACARL